jgi:hypothetical protein
MTSPTPKAIPRPHKTAVPPELTRRKQDHAPSTPLRHDRGSPRRPLPRRSPSPHDRGSRTRTTQACSTRSDTPSAFDTNRRSLSHATDNRRPRLKQVLGARSAVASAGKPSKLLVTRMWIPRITDASSASPHQAQPVTPTVQEHKPGGGSRPARGRHLPVANRTFNLGLAKLHVSRPTGHTALGRPRGP